MLWRPIPVGLLIGLACTPHEAPSASVHAVVRQTAQASDRCLPVAACQMFPAHVEVPCVRARGTDVDLPEALGVRHIALLERRCPGDPGTDESLSECVEFVDVQLSCTWRPLLRDPGYGCELRNASCVRVD